MTLTLRNQHSTAVQEKNLEHEDAVRDVCADHPNPPTPQEKREANETRVKNSQLGWYEATRGVTAWYRFTRDHRGSSAQRILGSVGRVLQPQRCQKMSDVPSYVELWESRIRECEKFFYQTEKIQTNVPDSCKVFIVRSLVPRDLEKDLLKVHSTANYKATKEYILERAYLKRDAHFDDKGKHDKLVPMEVDALLAKVSALKDARGVGEEAGGTEPHCHDSCEGGPHRLEEEAWTDHTSNTLDLIETELMAVRANKGGEGGKGEKGKGFQGNCNYCGKSGHRLNECWVKDQDMKAKGGSWSNKGGGKGPKGQGSLHRSTTDIGKAAVQFGESKGGAWNQVAKRCVWGGGQGKGHPGKGGTYWFDGVSPQGGSQDGGAWRTVSSNTWTPKLFLMEDNPPGLVLQNSLGALGEIDSEQEIPLASLDDFPSISYQIECEKKFVPKGGRFNTQTQNQKKEARTRSEIMPKRATTSEQELHPLIRAEDKDDHPGRHAVSDSSQWMSVCPTTGFTRLQRVLDSGLTAMHQTACVQR